MHYLTSDRNTPPTIDAPPLLNLSIMSHGPEARDDKRVELADVEAVNTPLGTRSWRPLEHAGMIERFHSAADRAGVTVMQGEHLLARDGLRYFGLFQVNLPTDHGEIATVFGLRNSHDKSFRAGIMAGDAPLLHPLQT